MRDAVVFDIDGVLADNVHRLHFLEVQDWSSFYAVCANDTPVAVSVAMLRALAQIYYVCLLTGRPESLQVQTYNWLMKHTVLGHHDWRLIMRPEKDYRTAEIVKKEALIKLQREYSIHLLVDDDPGVIAVASSLGIPTMHFCNGVRCV